MRQPSPARLVKVVPLLVRACETALPFYETCDDPRANRCARILRHALDQAARAGGREARNGAQCPCASRKILNRNVLDECL